MLLSLRIENFALVDSLDLELQPGLTILTGETGAGKSIVLDALDAVLGGKVTSRAIRAGSDRAYLAASFHLDADLQQWLTTHSLPLTPESPNQLVCSREILSQGGSVRSRARVNGTLVNKQQLEELRDRLIEITAQGQTVQLGHPPQQRTWLDSYGGNAVLKQRDRVTSTYATYQQASQTLEKRRRMEQQRLQQLDLFEYQLKELSAANLSDPEELTQLEQERSRLSHSVELQQQSYQVYQALYENENGLACADLLGQAEATLQTMAELDDQVQPMLELVSNALAQVIQAGRDVNLYGDGLESDPQRLEEVQQRIGELKQICRKYGPNLAEAIALYEQLQADMQALTDGGQSLANLEQRVQECNAQLSQDCAELTVLRQAAAQALQERLVSELKPLAMDKVQFVVDLKPISPTAMGADQVQFLLSPNPGEPLHPLTAIASGGEMSRFLLALQASFSQVDPVGTLVFDEIDVGVSGRVTQAIADKLFNLSRDHQVLCVTHQAIVAAMADHHYYVEKQVITAPESKTSVVEPSSESSGVRTVVRLRPLTEAERRAELAQLAGGQTAQEALAFADSLVAHATRLRATPPQASDQPSQDEAQSTAQQQQPRTNRHSGSAAKKGNGEKKRAEKKLVETEILTQQEILDPNPATQGSVEAPCVDPSARQQTFRDRTDLNPTAIAQASSDQASSDHNLLDQLPVKASPAENVPTVDETIATAPVGSARAQAALKSKATAKPETPHLEPPPVEVPPVEAKSPIEGDSAAGWIQDCTPLGGKASSKSGKANGKVTGKTSGRKRLSAKS